MSPSYHSQCQYSLLCHHFQIEVTSQIPVLNHKQNTRSSGVISGLRKRSKCCFRSSKLLKFTFPSRANTILGAKFRRADVNFTSAKELHIQKCSLKPMHKIYYCFRPSRRWIRSQNSLRAVSCRRKTFKPLHSRPIDVFYGSLPVTPSFC